MKLCWGRRHLPRLLLRRAADARLTARDRCVLGCTDVVNNWTAVKRPDGVHGRVQIVDQSLADVTARVAKPRRRAAGR